MQMILKSAGTHIEVDLNKHESAINVSWMCKLLDVKYSTVKSYIHRDGLSLDAALKKAVDNQSK
ncbi:conserved hypothetical protein [Pantoea sp. aB]|jgi:hypothetical protein|nr:conserved hypothetical protein [Pantoea sp. aB]